MTLDLKVVKRDSKILILFSSSQSLAHSVNKNHWLILQSWLMRPWMLGLKMITLGGFHKELNLLQSNVCQTCSNLFLPLTLYFGTRWWQHMSKVNIWHEVDEVSTNLFWQGSWPWKRKGVRPIHVCILGWNSQNFLAKFVKFL